MTGVQTPPVPSYSTEPLCRYCQTVFEVKDCDTCRDKCCINCLFTKYEEEDFDGLWEADEALKDGERRRRRHTSLTSYHCSRCYSLQELQLFCVRCGSESIQQAMIRCHNKCCRQAVHVFCLEDDRPPTLWLCSLCKQVAFHHRTPTVPALQIFQTRSLDECPEKIDSPSASTADPLQTSNDSPCLGKFRRVTSHSDPAKPHSGAVYPTSLRGLVELLRSTHPSLAGPRSSDPGCVKKSEDVSDDLVVVVDEDDSAAKKMTDFPVLSLSNNVKDSSHIPSRPGVFCSGTFAQECFTAAQQTKRFSEKLTDDAGEASVTEQPFPRGRPPLTLLESTTCALSSAAAFDPFSETAVITPVAGAPNKTIFPAPFSIEKHLSPQKVSSSSTSFSRAGDTMNLYSSQDISPLMSGIHINPANICWNPVMTGIQHLVSLTVQSTHSLRNPAIQDWVDTVEAQRRDARHVINLVKQWDSIRDRCQSLCMPVCGKGLKRVWTQRSTTFPWPRLKQQNSSSGSSDGQASRARHKLCSTSDGCTTITSHASSRVASYHLPAQSAQFVSGHLALSSLSLQRPVIPRTADGSVSRDALWNIPPPKALLTALETVHWGALFNMLWPSVQQVYHECANHVGASLGPSWKLLLLTPSNTLVLGSRWQKLYKKKSPRSPSIENLPFYIKQLLYILDRLAELIKDGSLASFLAIKSWSDLLRVDEVYQLWPKPRKGPDKQEAAVVSSGVLHARRMLEQFQAVLHYRQYIFVNQSVYDGYLPENADEPKGVPIESLYDPCSFLSLKLHCAFSYFGFYPLVSFCESPKAGVFLKAVSFIPRRTILTEYCGKVEPQHFNLTTLSNHSNSIFDLLNTGLSDTSLCINPEPYTNIARFLSHGTGRQVNILSCTLKINGKARIFLISRRGIASGETLSINYNAGQADEYPTDGFTDVEDAHNSDA